MPKKIQKIIPLGNRIVVEELEEKREDGIYVPKDESVNRVMQGKIIACNSKIHGIKKGDIVLFVRHNARQIDSFFVVEEEDILATL